MKVASSRFARRLVAYTLLWLGYCLLVGCTHLADRLILFPSTQPIDALGATRRLISYHSNTNRSETRTVEVWQARSSNLRRDQTAQLCVLRFYGNGDRAEPEVVADANAWDGRAVELWCMNYPGYGGNPGPARLDDVGPSSLAVFDAMKAQAGTRPIVISGYSFGTTAALYVAAQRPGEVAGLVLHNPPAMRQMILGSYGWWNLWLLAGPLAVQVPATLDSVTNARHAHAPAIFLLAEKDDYVLPRYQRLVAEAYAGPKQIVVLPGANHNTSIVGRGLEDYHLALDRMLPRMRLRERPAETATSP